MRVFFFFLLWDFLQISEAGLIMEMLAPSFGLPCVTATFVSCTFYLKYTNLEWASFKGAKSVQTKLSPN